MEDQRVDLLEGVFVQEDVEAFACGELAAGALGLDPILAAAQPREFLQLVEFVKPVLNCHLTHPRLKAGASDWPPMPQPLGWGRA